MNLSRKLTERYPHSAAAYCLRGSLACSLRQYGEATSAFHTAVGIQPRSADAHFGLGLVEGAQGHFAAALPHLQRCAELEPDSFIPYVFLSDFASSMNAFCVGNTIEVGWDLQGNRSGKEPEIPPAVVA